ncbi:hypothetical protein TNCV_3451781 [Trichonephila clavipes]|nr:hypothetical protein TNCV_3451781 [Trichonephila clavipes]
MNVGYRISSRTMSETDDSGKCLCRAVVSFALGLLIRLEITSMANSSEPIKDPPYIATVYTANDGVFQQEKAAYNMAKIIRERLEDMWSTSTY